MSAPPIRIWFAVVLLLPVSGSAAAQTSRVEASGGYQTTRLVDQTLPFGWSADVAVNLTGRWGVVGEVSGAYKTDEDAVLGVHVDLSLHTLGAGARWSTGADRRVVLFLQALAGAERARASAEILGTAIGSSSTTFMLQPGGGVNVRVARRIGILGQLDYRRVFLDEDDGGRAGRNALRILFGARVGF